MYSAAPSVIAVVDRAPVKHSQLSSPVLLAVLLTLTLCLVWWAIGLAALALLRIDTSGLRATLSAPALGTALTVMPLFVLSDLGASMATAGPIAGAVIVIAALIILGVKRPRVPLPVLPVLVLAVVDLLLLGRPMFHFDFDWIADANGDMGFYVLAASQHPHHGLRSAVDVHALAQDRDILDICPESRPPGNPPRSSDLGCGGVGDRGSTCRRGLYADARCVEHELRLLSRGARDAGFAPVVGSSGRCSARRVSASSVRGAATD